ncbi:MAG: penicillin-binding transpeptidase domain-containing protein, partial [Candidatus Omnitrophota bacterium]|nr:penicillin-binding transpeptidase domain-containing protein [Candidatus Omnitrophota bacterium]
MKERALIAVISVFFILLWASLFYTQVLRFGYYSRLSRNNSIRIVPIDSPRGNILDRNGVPLVTNRLSFDVALIYEELKDRKGLIKLLSGILKMPGEAITDALDKAGKKPYIPVTIAEDINKEKAIMLEEASCDMDGLLIQTKSKRNYLYGSVGSHCFGYLSQISEPELEGLKSYGYRMRDMIGRDGIEKFYNTYLEGTDGGIQIEIDSLGRQTRILGLKEPSSGKDLYLTLDIRLQLACDKLLGEHKGAVIAMDPRNGEVLALASHPAFDPNTFVKPKTSAERVRLLKDKTGKPMFNRAISGLYPPGSIFKIVTATSALETNRIKPDTRFFCGGSYKLGNATFDCWKKEGHGSQNIRGGLTYSCNVFFYNTARAVG